ncbi:MAG: hypothetical protein LC753_20250 [Acidobacteria bacterium]|nr:hypothetical protein [Acidobacteriota bacterium]MCA1652494.1 hypothetical protein [Acidobacteriota bacterium]
MWRANVELLPWSVAALRNPLSALCPIARAHCAPVDSSRIRASVPLADDRSGAPYAIAAWSRRSWVHDHRHGPARRGCGTAPIGPDRLALDSGVHSRGDTVHVSSCCAGNCLESSTRRCPQSGSAGPAVELQTVKALLTEQALARLEQTDHRFCADARCDVVYFSGTGSQFGTADLRVPVWQKLPFGSRIVCYCFGESETSIRAEIERTGRSSAVRRIREHITAGRCACEVRNPRGTCCLGDVMAAVKRMESGLVPRPSAAAVPGVSDVS